MDTKNKQKFLDDLGALMGKHKASVLDTMEVYSSFMSFLALQSGDPVDFMKKLTELLKFHLDRHYEVGNIKRA